MMKRASNFSLVVYAVILIVAYFIGNTILSNASSAVQGSLLGFAIACILVGFIFNVVLMEVGHIIGAKIGGYRILSVSLLGLTLVRMNNKWKFMIGAFDGFTGETAVAPKKENANPFLYFWGGTGLIVLEILILVLLPIIFTDLYAQQQLLMNAGFIVAAIGGLILVYNVVPMRLDTANDAIMMMNVKKDIRPIYHQILTIKGNLYEGDAIPQIEPLEKVGYITGKLNYYALLERTYRGEYQEAEAIVDALMNQSEKLSDEVYDNLIPAKLFILMMTKTREEIEEFVSTLPPRLKKTVSSPRSIEAARTYLYYSVKILESHSDFEVASNKFKSRKAGLRELGRLQAEEAFVHRLMEEVKANHADWLTAQTKQSNEE